MAYFLHTYKTGTKTQYLSRIEALAPVPETSMERANRGPRLAFMNTDRSTSPCSHCISVVALSAAPISAIALLRKNFRATRSPVSWCSPTLTSPNPPLPRNSHTLWPRKWRRVNSDATTVRPYVCLGAVAQLVGFELRSRTRARRFYERAGGPTRNTRGSRREGIICIKPNGFPPLQTKDLRVVYSYRSPRVHLLS